MRTLLLILALAMPPASPDGLVRTDIVAGPTLTWEAITGAKSFRVWRCPVGQCALRYYDVQGLQKPFPMNLAQWTLVADTKNAQVRSYPVSCGTYQYSVQAIGAGKKVANGGNVVRCP